MHNFSWIAQLVPVFFISFGLLSCGEADRATPPESEESERTVQRFSFDAPAASHYARLALKGISREYPNKLDHVMNDTSEVQSPAALHPAFYGCFDWHSAVHGHWMLVRILKLFPDLPQSAEIRAALNHNLSAENILAEVAYLKQGNRKSFERTYGWAWLLKLAEELHGWNDADGRSWSQNLKPLAEAMVARFLEFLPRQTYPIRRGVHANTAFALAFALDYAQALNEKSLIDMVVERAGDYYGSDRAYAAAAWEPDGDDFFSPALMEADLMRRVLDRQEFGTWFREFMPRINEGAPQNLLEPAHVSDRSDPKIVHLDGLNLSRAWCLEGIASALPADHPSQTRLLESARRHAEATLPHIASGHYEGEHWLASFAVYMLSSSAR